MKRRAFHGTVQIVRYNWPFYALGLAAILAGLVLLTSVRFGPALFVLGCLGLSLSTWWLLGSLLASYWAYDASDMRTLEWLVSPSDLPLPSKREGRGEGCRPLLVFGSGGQGVGSPGLAACRPKGGTPEWINLHAGLDESTPELTQLLGAPIAVYDFFDAQEMTEPSIRRARAIARNEHPAIAVDYRRLPRLDASVDLASVIFAAHEIRSDKSRLTFFRELFRILRPGGRLIVVEHVRDGRNFVAFGPGFFHFFPLGEWRRLAQEAGFRMSSMERRTPFVVGFVLEKP